MLVELILELLRDSEQDLSSVDGNSDKTSPTKQNIRKKKCGRKPSFRPKFIEGMRIYKTDIRRRYPEMYANVMNSLDGKLLRQFFYEFCSPIITYERKNGDCAFSSLASALVPKPIFGLPQYVNSAVAFLTTTILMDMVIRLQNPRVITVKGVPGSRIEADNILELTVLYSAKRVPVSKDAQINQPLPSSGFQFIDPVTNDLVCLTLLPTPLRMKVTLSLVLTLDPSNHINGIYLSHRNSVSTPINLK